MNLTSQSAVFFKSEQFIHNQARYQNLTNGQAPKAVMVTCSDSRVMPGWITQALPGELFVIRNAGNIIPAKKNASEIAALDYAVQLLKVEEIIVCGHSGCGAMNALLHPEKIAKNPSIQAWVKESQSLVTRLQHNKRKEHADVLTTLVEQNVLLQVERIKQLDFVRDKLDKLKINAWVYDIPTGNVRAYDEMKKTFVPLQDLLSMSSPNQPFFRAKL